MPQQKLNLCQADFEGSTSGFVSDEELAAASGFLQAQIDTRVTDGLNLGDGSGVFAQKNGTILEFKTLNGGLGIDIVANPVDTAEELDIVFNINEVPDLGPVVSGLFYRRDQNLESSFDGVTTEDYVFRIGDFDTHYTAIFAGSGVFEGPASVGGKVVVANPNGPRECSVFERGFPTAFPATVVRGGRAVIMETFAGGVYASGIWLGPTQRILMGDLEDYTFHTTLLNDKELANFGKKVTSVLVNSPIGSDPDNVAHYTFHKMRVASNNTRQMIAHEIKAQAQMDDDLAHRMIGTKTTAVNIDDGEQGVFGTYEALQANVVQSGGGVLDVAKAGYFSVQNPGPGSIDKVFVVHIGPPSGAQTIGKSLWCEGDACFGEDVQIDNTLNVDGLATFNDGVDVDSGDVNITDNLNVTGDATIETDLQVDGNALFSGDVSVSGCLETEIRRDASRREAFGLFDTIAFNRNLIYGSTNAGASVLTISDPGKNGQVTKVIFAQNSGGTIALSFSYSGGIRWRGGAFPGLSPTPNGYDIFTFLYDSTDDVLYGDYAQGFI